MLETALPHEFNRRGNNDAIQRRTEGKCLVSDEEKARLRFNGQIA
jgi:hypothetical protein